MTVNPAHARTRFRQAQELVESLLDFAVPADQVIERYFKANRQMGSKDRGFAAETVYGILRHLRELQRLCQDAEQAPDAANLVAVYLLSKAGWGARMLQDTAVRAHAEDLVRGVRTASREDWLPAERLNLSDDALDRLGARFDATELTSLARALNQPAPVDMRVNTWRHKRADVQAALQAAGYDCDLTPYSPLGLRRAQRGPLFGTQEFRDGQIEIQDEGSQLIGLLAQARPRQKIADFCAGAGGKALLLSAEMRNTGVVLACDVSARRLQNMRPRLKRAGADNIRILHIRDERDAQLQKHTASCDAVLVDAPCSGSGTWRRNPDMKWRDINIAELGELQTRILRAAEMLVKPGGRLIYATCSLFEAENQAVVESFLNDHPQYQLVPANQVLEQSGVPEADSLVDAAGMLQMLPHRHGTDGFFAAVLQKTG